MLRTNYHPSVYLLLSLALFTAAAGEPWVTGAEINPILLPSACWSKTGHDWHQSAACEKLRCSQPLTPYLKQRSA